VPSLFGAGASTGPRRLLVSGATLGALGRKRAALGHLGCLAAPYGPGGDTAGAQGLRRSPAGDLRTDRECMQPTAEVIEARLRSQDRLRWPPDARAPRVVRWERRA
jgi:hypothetical protein